MIHDTLENNHRHRRLHPGFAAAFSFIERDDLASLPDGRYAIDGQRVFAIVSHGEGKGRAAALLESHRKYIDVQFVVSGNECIGVSALKDCHTVTTAYDPEKDIEFYSDRPDRWVSLAPDEFVVLYPEDAHAPLAGNGGLVKVVVKVVSEWER